MAMSFDKTRHHSLATCVDGLHTRNSLRASSDLRNFAIAYYNCTVIDHTTIAIQNTGVGDNNILCLHTRGETEKGSRYYITQGVRFFHCYYLVTKLLV